MKSLEKFCYADPAMISLGMPQCATLKKRCLGETITPQAWSTKMIMIGLPHGVACQGLPTETKKFLVKESES